MRWISPYRHSRKTAKIDNPVKIIQSSKTPRSGVSLPDNAVSALIALMLCQFPEGLAEVR
jgi:hypothetical protein